MLESIFFGDIKRFEPIIFLPSEQGLWLDNIRLIRSETMIHGIKINTSTEDNIDYDPETDGSKI